MDAVRLFRSRLEVLSSAADAAAMRAYMRDQFAFLGIKSPVRTRCLRDCLMTGLKPAPGDLLALSRALLAQPEREFAYAACDLLKARKRLLGPDDLPGLRDLILTRPWWDTVDSLAAHPVGSVVLRHRSLSGTMEAWGSDSSLWIRRTALLHQLTYRERTDPALLFGLCARLAPEEDFFIRKAIGWALRTYARTDPEGVRAFTRRTPLSPLSLREATKHLAGGRRPRELGR